MNTELLMLLCVAAMAQKHSGLKTVYINCFKDKGAQYMGAYMDDDTSFGASRIVDNTNWPVRAEHSGMSFITNRIHWSFS